MPQFAQVTSQASQPGIHKHKSQVKHLNQVSTITSTSQASGSLPVAEVHQHESQVKHLNHKHKHKSSIWIPTPLQRFTSTSHKSSISTTSTSTSQASGSLPRCRGSPAQVKGSPPHCGGIHSISTHLLHHGCHGGRLLLGDLLLLLCRSREWFRPRWQNVLLDHGVGSDLLIESLVVVLPVNADSFANDLDVAEALLGIQ